MPTADNEEISNTEEKALKSAKNNDSYSYRPIDSSSSTVILFGAINASLPKKGLKKVVRESILTTPPPTPPRHQISSQNIVSSTPKGPSPIKPPRQRKQGTSYPVITTVDDSTSSVHSSFEFHMASGNFSTYVSTCVSMESIVTETSAAISSSVVYAETSSCSTNTQFLLKPTSKSPSVFECNKSDHPSPPSSDIVRPMSAREIYSPPESAAFLKEKIEINDDTMDFADTSMNETLNFSDHSEWDAPVFVPTTPSLLCAHVHSAIPSKQVSKTPRSLVAEYDGQSIPALIALPGTSTQTLSIKSEKQSISSIPNLINMTTLSRASPLSLKNDSSPDAGCGRDYGSILSSSFGETSPMYAGNMEKPDSLKKVVDLSDILSDAPKVAEIIHQCPAPPISLTSPLRDRFSPFKLHLSSSITEKHLQFEKAAEISNPRVVEKPAMLPLPPSSFPAASHTSALAATKSPKSCEQSHAVSSVKSHLINSEHNPVPIKFGREDSKGTSRSQSSPTTNQEIPLAWQKVMLSPPGPRLTLVERRISQFNSPSATTASPASATTDRMSTKIKYLPARTIPHNPKIQSNDASNRTAESEMQKSIQVQIESGANVLFVDTNTSASNDQLSDHDLDASTDEESDDTVLIPSGDSRQSTDPAQIMKITQSAHSTQLIDPTQSNKSSRSIGPMTSSSINGLNVSIPGQNMRESVLQVKCEEGKTAARSRYLSHIQNASKEKEKEKERAYEKPGLLCEDLKEKVRALTAAAVVARKGENAWTPPKSTRRGSMVCLVSEDEDGPVSTSSNLPLSSTSNLAYEKYDFMRAMKISERTVRLMMLADGLHSSDIQAYSPMDSLSA